MSENLKHSFGFEPYQQRLQRLQRARNKYFEP